MQSAAARGSARDPADDTFGGFLDQPDIARIVASHDDSAITVRVTFHYAILPPDFDTGLGTVGSIELDTDHDAATGGTAFLDVCPSPRSTGFDYFLTLWGFQASAEDPNHGTAPLLDTAGNDIALADVTYEPRALTAVIPRGSLPGDADIAMVFGTPSEPTDCAPDLGVVRAAELLFDDGFEPAF